MDSADQGTGTIHQRLAKIARSIRYEDLPKDVVHLTKRLILDSLGCVAGGFASAPAGAARKAIERMGGNPTSVVIGTKGKTSPALAAFANGTALRYLDFNASYSGRDPSKMSGLVPAAIAGAEIEDRSGRDLIAALVAGAEVQGRLSEFAGDPDLKNRGWHHTCNLQMGAAVVAARLLSDDADKIAEAISLSTTHQNTLAQIQHGKITMIKATADGYVAKGGVEAALLAVSGLTGPDQIFEGHAGWAARVAGKVDYDGLLAPVGDAYRIARARIKAFAVVGPAQAVVQAAVELRNNIRPDQVDSIVIQVPERILKDPAANDPIKKFPKNRETADHSFHYVVAIALIDGEVGEAQYAPDKLASPVVRGLIEKATLQADAEFSKNRWGGGGVRITLRDGTVHEKRYPAPPGHPTNPLSDAQLARKYDRQMEELFPQAQSEAIKAAVFDLDACKKVSEFGRLLMLG
jgi:2-methylcitrate dehydratase